MPWIQAHLTTGKEQAPLIELLFENLGALSTTLEDAEDEPLLEPGPGELPIWQRTRVTGLFEGDIDSDDLRHRINQTLNSDVTLTLQLEVLEDQAWERAWLDNFHAMSFGQRLWVAPQGKRPEQPDAVIVELDPGLAFGTGTHPTTALCLQWLDRTPPEQLEAIDFGCGSGILAVAALKLGARRVYATDHDPQALQATRANAEKNQVLGRLQLCDSGELQPVDLVMANILAGTLIELRDLLAGLTRPGGRIILSGILSEQAERVSDAYADAFHMQPPRQQEEWVLLEGRRK
ncbi:50S ribosomal protein L11 methyltransferase [Sedimenticola thiotaurini]|uniref:50S ribosomal protein L11 methyltransferase n=1 Tax=Sedimenticola thiotaurini TaxID=1543721 RepID=UPI00069C66D9|nr:50S ribosomal protein L11 methyltransferase [Sedimenticola thiotaurini]